MAAKPLTLRDFLALECESSSDGFRGYPRHLSDGAAPVRLLIEAELHLGRSPSRSPSILFPKSPTLAKISHLSRSLSRRLRWSLSRRREYEEEFDVDDRDSCGLPSPMVSSCSESESEWESETEADKKAASDFAKSSSATSGSLGGVDAANKALKDESIDKEQLSPVSIMDFPFDDDGEEEDEAREERDADTCSPSFRQSLEHLGRTKAQSQHKIRRLEGEARIDPVDLEAKFGALESEYDSESDGTHLQSSSASNTTTPEPDDHHQNLVQEQEPDEYRLLGLLKDTVQTGIDDTSERLLLDFFLEQLEFQTLKLLDKEDALVRGAEDWLEGAGTQWGLADVLCAGEAAVAEMERRRRWMSVDEEERDVSAAVEGLVMDELVDELVNDLVL